jgi:hypothetical protein
MNLMNILDRIENKLDKETGSNKSGSHKTPEEKGRSRSGSRHHHHSQGHPNRGAHRNSIPSPVKKHHKKFCVDDMKGKMNKIKPPYFDG